MENQRFESWPEPLLPSPLVGASRHGAQPTISGWTFASQQSPLSDFSKAVDLSAEFPYSTLKRLPEDGTLWTRTPTAEHHRYHHEAATANRSVNQVVRNTATCDSSPISPADLQRQLHDEAEAILSDFKETLTRSMTLHASSTKCPSSDGHGSVSANNIDGYGDDALPPCPLPGCGATPANLAEPVASREGSLAQRERSFWSAGAESASAAAASELARQTHRTEASVDSRARGPQRRLNWDEESWSGAPPPLPPHGHATGRGDLSATRSQASQQQQHGQPHSGSSGRDGGGASTRTPLVVPKRLNLMMPITATSSPASELRKALDTGEKSSSLRSSAGPCGGLPSAHVELLPPPPQQPQSAHWEQAAAQRAKEALTTPGTHFAALLAGATPRTLTTPFSLKPLGDAAVPSYPPSHVSLGFDPRAQHHGGWSEQGRQQRAHVARDDLDFSRTATPLSMQQQEPLDGGHSGASEAGSSPRAIQQTPRAPEVSATPDWLPSSGHRSSVSTRRTLATPPSEATFGYVGLGPAATAAATAEGPRSANAGAHWPDVAEEADEDGADGQLAFHGSSQAGLPGREEASQVPQPVPQPPQHPWLARDNPGGAAVGRGSTDSRPVIMPQHTDLSNLLDSSPSGSVAGLAFGGTSDGGGDDGASQDVDLAASSEHAGVCSGCDEVAVGASLPVGEGCASAEGREVFSDLFHGEEDSLFEPGDSLGLARLQAAPVGPPGRWAGTWISEESSFTGSIAGGTCNGDSKSGSEAGAAASPNGTLAEEEDGVSAEQHNSMSSASGMGEQGTAAGELSVGGDARTPEAMRSFGGGDSSGGLRWGSGGDGRRARSRSRSRSSERENSVRSQQSQLRAWRRAQRGGAQDEDDELDGGGEQGDGRQRRQEVQVADGRGGSGSRHQSDDGVDGSFAQQLPGSCSPTASDGGSPSGASDAAGAAAGEPSLGQAWGRNPGMDGAGVVAHAPLRNVPSYEVSWASDTDRELAGEPSHAWGGSAASRRETRDTDPMSLSSLAPAATTTAPAPTDSPEAAATAPAAVDSGPKPAASTPAWTPDAAGAAKLIPSLFEHTAADVEPPTYSLQNTPQEQHAMLASHAKEGASFSFFRFNGAARASSRGVDSSTRPPTRQWSPRGGTGGGAAPEASTAVSDWSFADGKAILYDPIGYGSSASSTEFYGVGGGPALRPDATPPGHSSAKTIMSWQIQENPAYEEDLDATAALSQLGDETNQAQLSPLAHRSPLSPAPPCMGGGRTAAPQDLPHPGLHAAAIPAWSPLSANLATTAAAAVSCAPGVTPLVVATAFAGPVKGSHRGGNSGGGAVAAAAIARESYSGGSSDSDSPRTSALNRVLASSGLGTAGSAGARRLPGRRGLLHHNHHDGAVAGSHAEDDVVDDRRDTAATSRCTGGSHSHGSISMGLVPPGSSRVTISAIIDADDRSLILELEHAQALLLQTLAAASEPLLLTPPPPPSPAPHPSSHALVLRTREPEDGADAEEAGPEAGGVTPDVSSGSRGAAVSEHDVLRLSTCSSGSGGLARGSLGANPLVAQVATAAVGKALARVVKLSRENQGLQRLNEQLRSELSNSSSKHMELQTRSKLLHTMLNECGREAEKKAASHQRRFLRMEAHLSSSHQRIRELERINTQLSLEGRQAARQLEQAQVQVAEAGKAAAALRGQTALLEQQLAAAHAAGEAERRLAEALVQATEGAAAAHHRAAHLEERLAEARAGGEEEQCRAEALREQLEALEGLLGATRAEAGEVRRVAEVEAEALRAQVLSLEGQLEGAYAAAVGERRAAEGAAAAQRARAEALEAELDAARTGGSEESRRLEEAAEALRREITELEQQLMGARAKAEADRCRMEAEAAAEVEQLLSACAEAEARAQELEAQLRAVQAQAEQVPQLEAELVAARKEVDRLQAESEEAAAAAQQAEQQLAAELQAARVAMAELAAERAAARAEALRKEDDAQRASLAAREASSAAASAADNYTRVAAEAREAEARHEVVIAEAEVAAAELRRQLDAAAWEAQRLTSQAAEAAARAAEAETRERVMLEELRGAVAEAERAQSELEAARQVLAQMKSAKEAEADSAAATVSELELALAAESARVLEEVQRREQAEAAAALELRQMRAQLQAAREAERRAGAERDDLRTAHGASAQRLEQLCAELAAARGELEMAHQERARLCAEQAELLEMAETKAAGAQREAATRCDAATAAEAELRQALARLVEAETIHGSLAAQLEDARGELAVARDAAGEAQSRLQGAEQDKAVLAERVRQLRCEMEEQGAVARERLDAEEARAAKAEAEAEGLRHEQLLLRDNLDNLMEDLAAAREALAEREAALAMAQGGLEAAAAGQERTLAEAGARAEAAEVALESERCRAADLEAEMRVATRRLVELQKAAEEREKEIEKERESQQQLQVAATAAASAASAGGSGGVSYERLLLYSPQDVVAVSAAQSRAQSRRASHAGGDAVSQPASAPQSPSLKLAGEVVAAHAELADLRRRHEDAEELIGQLRQDLARQSDRCGQLQARLTGQEAELAAARREREEALLQLQLRAAAAANAPPPAAGLPPQFKSSEIQRQVADEAAAAAAAAADGGRRQQPWRLQTAVRGGGGTSMLTASAVYSSAAWSPGSSLRAERCSLAIVPSPTRSSVALRDSSAFDAGFGWLRGGGAAALDTDGGAFGSAGGAAAAAAASGEVLFPAAATPLSLWVEPGSVSLGRTVGTLPPTPLMGGIGTPMVPLVARGDGRYYYSGVDAGGAAPAAYLRSGAAQSPDASISLCIRGRNGGGGSGLGPGGYSAGAELSPRVRGFEPLLPSPRRPSLAQEASGFRASYGSVAGGGGTTDACSPALGDQGRGVHGGGGGGSGAGSVSASVSAGVGMQLTVQLLELRYAVQQVEQAAGELAAVLLDRTGGADAAVNTFSTPHKSGGSSGRVTGGCQLRLSLTTRHGDGPTSEAALQERAWLADSLTNLTSRAGSVAAQLTSCLDAAVAGGGGGDGNRVAEQRPGAGSGSGSCGRQQQPHPHPVVSPLALRVLEAELADLRAQFGEAQQQAEQAVESLQAQHLDEVAALVAETAQYRQLLLRLREHVGALEREAARERVGRREQDEEARLYAESQHRLARDLADRCRDQEAVIGQLRAQLTELDHHFRQQRDRASDSGYSGRGPNASHGRGPSPVISGAGGPGPGGGGQGPPFTYREYGVSSPSVGETCASTQGAPAGAGGAGSGGSCGSSCGGGGGSFTRGGCGGFSSQQRTPNSADMHPSLGGTFCLDLVNTDPHQHQQQHPCHLHYGQYDTHQQGHHHPASSSGNSSQQRHLTAARAAPAASLDEAADAGGHNRSSGGGGEDGVAPSEGEARLWAELLHLLRAPEGGSGSHSRGTSGGSGPAGTPPATLLALTAPAAAGEAVAASMHLVAQCPVQGQLIAGAGVVDYRAAAAAGAVSSRGRAEMLARAVSHIALLSSQNRKLGKLLRGVTGARAGAGPYATGGEGVAARLEALQRENNELREKYQAAKMAHSRSEAARNTLRQENRQLTSQVLGLIEARSGDLQARGASAAASAATAAATASGTTSGYARAGTGRGDRDEDPGVEVMAEKGGG